MVRIALQKPAAGATSRSRTLFSGEQPVRDPREQGSAREHQAGKPEHPENRDGEARPHRDRAHCSPNDRAALMDPGQVARGERDDDGVVPGEHQVDHHDRGEGGPEFGRYERGHLLLL